MAVNSACKIAEEDGRKPEKLARKNPALLRINPPKPALTGLPIQLPSTLRTAQSKLLLFRLIYRSREVTGIGDEKARLMSSTELIIFVDNRVNDICSFYKFFRLLINKLIESDALIYKIMIGFLWLRVTI